MLSRCFNPSKSFTSKLPNLCTLKTFRSVHLLLSGKAKPHWNVMQNASKCNLCLHRFMVYKSRTSFDFVYLSPPTIKMTYTSASDTGLPGNVVEPLPGNLLCIGATLISDILCGKNDGRLVLEFWRPPFSRIFQDFRGSCNLGKAHDYMLTQMASPEVEEISSYSSTSLSLLGNLMRIKQNSYKVLEFLVFRLLEHCYPNQWWRNPSTRLSNSSKSMAPRRTQYPPASTSWLFRRMPSYLPNPWPTDGHAKFFFSHTRCQSQHERWKPRSGRNINFLLFGWIQTSPDLIQVLSDGINTIAAALGEIAEVVLDLRLQLILLLRTGKVWIWPQKQLLTHLRLNI